MRRGFLLHDDTKRHKTTHFNFNIWGPLYAHLVTPYFKGIHVYQHAERTTRFYCWEASAHAPVAHFHYVFTEKDADMVYLPEWIRTPMMDHKNNAYTRWCLQCVSKHNVKAKKPRTSAEYWAFLVLFKRNDPDSLLSTLPTEIAHHIASFLLGPTIPLLRYQRCTIQDQIVAVELRAEEEEEEEDSFSSDLQEEQVDLYRFY